MYREEQQQPAQLAQQQQQQPLTTRSTNTHLSTASAAPASGGDEKTVPFKGNGFLRAGQAERNQGQYVSPSDGIMSPCTKKLSDLKGKRFKSARKPQSLFAKTIQKRSFENGNGNVEKGSSLSSEEKAV